MFAGPGAHVGLAPSQWPPGLGPEVTRETRASWKVGVLVHWEEVGHLWSFGNALGQRLALAPRLAYCSVDLQLVPRHHEPPLGLSSSDFMGLVLAPTHQQSQLGQQLGPGPSPGDSSLGSGSFRESCVQEVGAAPGSGWAGGSAGGSQASGCHPAGMNTRPVARLWRGPVWHACACVAWR